ncbi:hypothetical protein [Providencia alcalifaciens]|uniref:hypothetical protein n=1 Tax=Providencia alcalifaciens TaxID=126385 RepID=UPI003D2C08E5
MQVPIWVATTVLIALFVVIILSVMFVLNSLFDLHRQKSLGKKIKNKLAVGEVRFDDFKNFQKVNYMSDDKALQMLEMLKADIDFDVTNEFKELKIKLDSLISEFIKKEPFSEFPSEIREALYLVKSKSNDPASIDSLAEKLSIYIKRQAKSERWMKVMTVVGALVGAIGLVLPYIIKN